jgi:hypothetical protein
MKKNIKTIIVCCISCIIILIALPIYIIARPELNKGVYLLYNEKDHTLLIANSESAKYIKKITMDLYRDTLSVNMCK